MHFFFSRLTSKYHELRGERGSKGHAKVTFSMSCILQGRDQVLMNQPHTNVQCGQLFYAGLGLTIMGWKFI